MIGIGEDDLGAEIVEVSMCHRLDRALGADGHERRRVDAAVRGRQHATARRAVRVRNRETEGHVWL